MFFEEIRPVPKRFGWRAKRLVPDGVAMGGVRASRSKGAKRADCYRPDLDTCVTILLVVRHPHSGIAWICWRKSELRCVGHIC
jgi:hypothetical protein